MSSNLVYWLKLGGGALLTLIGLVWALQGADVLGGSGMSGHAQWLFIGIIVGLFGLWLVYGSLRKKAAH